MVITGYKIGLGLPINLSSWLLVLLMFSGCATVKENNDNWLGRDKLYHFATAGVVGAGVSYVSRENGIAACSAPLIGISITLGLGAGKELYDKYGKKSFWSWQDMFWNFLGGTVGSMIVSKC